MALLTALVLLLGSVRNPWVDAGAASLIVIAIGALVTAILTRPFSVAVIAGAVQAVVAVVVYYGINVSDATAGNITAVLFALVGMFVVQPDVEPVEVKAVSSA